MDKRPVLLLALFVLLLSSGFALTLQVTTEPGSIADCGAYNDHRWWQGFNVTDNFTLSTITLNISNTGGGASVYVGINNGTWIENASANVSGGYTLYNFTFSGTKVLNKVAAPNSYNITVNYSRTTPTDIKISCAIPSAPNYTGGQMWSEATSYPTGDIQALIWGDVPGVDSVLPRVNVTVPLNGSFLNPSATNISIYASDNVGLANVTVVGNWTPSYNWCLQETANKSESYDGTCRLNYNGAYLLGGNWFPGVDNLGNMIDGIYFTGANPQEPPPTQIAYFYINYTKPSNAQSTSQWQSRPSALGFFSNEKNQSIPSGCWGQNPLQFRITAVYNQTTPAPTGWVAGECYSGSGYTLIFNATNFGSYFEEEGMYWNASLIPSSSIVITSPTNNTYVQFNLSGLADGPYQLYATACDTAGNCNATSNYTFNTDSTFPVLSNEQSIPNVTTIQQNAPITFNVTATDTNLQSVWLELGNGTNLTATHLSGGYYGVYLGSLKVGAYSWRFWANDSAGNYLSTSPHSITSYAPILGVCSPTLSNTTVLNFTFYDEEALTMANATLQWNGSINSIGLDIGMNGTNSGYSVPFCIYPSDATYTANLLFNYFNASSSTRQYYIVNANLPNTTNNISLFLLPFPSTANITVRVIQNGQDIVSVVQFQRYYVPTNTYRIVSMVKTAGDTSGSVAKLRPYDVWYRVVILVDGAAVATYDPVRITTDSLTFDVTNGQIGRFWTTYGTVSGSCLFVNSSNTISCSVTDSSGVSTQSEMVVKQKNALSETTICDQTSTTPGVTYLCHLGNSTDKTYSYLLTAVVSGDTMTLDSGTLTGEQSKPFSNTGLLLMGFIVLGIAMAGAINPASMIFMAFLGVFISQFSGLAIVTNAALIGLAIVGGLLVYRVRT
jgi:hypothetical protein